MSESGSSCLVVASAGTHRQPQLRPVAGRREPVFRISVDTEIRLSEFARLPTETGTADTARRKARQGTGRGTSKSPRGPEASWSRLEPIPLG
jgi:hypothetical protein